MNLWNSLPQNAVEANSMDVSSRESCRYSSYGYMESGDMGRILQKRLVLILDDAYHDHIEWPEGPNGRLLHLL